MLDDPLLCSVLIDCVGQWEKMDCCCLQRRGVPLLEYAEPAARVMTCTQPSYTWSCACTPVCSPSNTQLSFPLWSCSNLAERTFVPVWHRCICLETCTSHSCCGYAPPLAAGVSADQMPGRPRPYLSSVISISGAQAPGLPALRLVRHEAQSVGLLRSEGQTPSGGEPVLYLKPGGPVSTFTHFFFYLAGTNEQFEQGFVPLLQWVLSRGVFDF